MLAELFKVISILFTVHTIKYVNGKSLKLMLESMFYSSTILNICCLFLGLYQTFNVSIPL